MRTLAAPSERRRGLHAQATHLVEHHHDVTGSHQDLLVELLFPEHLDAHRQVLDPLVGACR